MATISVGAFCQKLVKIAAWMALATLVALPVVFWSRLPAQVPLHFGASGLPNGYGPREGVWILPLIGVFLFAVLTVVSHADLPLNLPWTLTEAQRQWAHPMAVRLTFLLRAEVLWTFAYIEWATAEVALGRVQGLGRAFLPVSLAVVLGTVAIFLVRVRRLR
jgi:hypothetical protein